MVDDITSSSITSSPETNLKLPILSGLGNIKKLMTHSKGLDSVGVAGRVLTEDTPEII